MDELRRSLLIIAWSTAALTLIGLYKPWVLLWWMDTQNRRKIIKLYGSVAAIAYIAYCFIQIFVP